MIAEMEREIPGNAGLLKSRIEDNRRHLREHGYVVGCGTWSPHINGCAVPIWSPQYQTYVVATIGLLSAMFDEKRLHQEAAPLMLQLGVAPAACSKAPGRHLPTVRRSPSVPTHNKQDHQDGVRMNWKAELDDLARREAFAREMEALTRSAPA